MDNVYLLKDLAQITGQSIYTVKYYLKIGLIKEAGRSEGTNFRYFNSSTVERLREIRKLRRENRSLKEIKAILRERKRQ